MPLQLEMREQRGEEWDELGEMSGCKSFGALEAVSQIGFTLSEQSTHEWVLIHIFPNWGKVQVAVGRTIRKLWELLGRNSVSHIS